MKQESADVVIVGGGVMGSSVAYHLLSLGLSDSVTVFEQDPVHEHSSTGLSVGGIRQLFSSAVNIALARFSVNFYGAFAEHMRTAQGSGPEVGFRRNGYLFLMNEEIETGLLRRADFQEAHGVKLERLDRKGLNDRFPELRVDDLTGGIFGVDAGFLDPYQVMRGFTAKAQELGAKFVSEQVTAIEVEDGRASAVCSAQRRVIAHRAVVDAAGAWSGAVGRLAGVEVPVDPVCRQVFQCQPPSPHYDRYPLTIDPSGLYFRPETGGRILVGKSLAEDPRTFTWNWRRDLFDQALWPDLAWRVPELESIRMESGWAGLYEVSPDDNAIIGAHPDLEQFYVIAGFSGHGMMQGPAAGLALAELIGTGRYTTLDVADLSIERFAKGCEAREDAII